MAESIHSLLINKNYAELKTFLQDLSRETLIKVIINERYNSFLRKYANFNQGQTPIDQKSNSLSASKRIPYLGWYWRNLNFAEKNISIGFAFTGYVGFMVNNDWYHDERKLNSDEFDTLMNIIDSALSINQDGGDIDKNHQKMLSKLEEIHPFIQSLPRPD